MFLETALVAMAASTRPRYLVTSFIDDLGFYDTTVWNPAAPTPEITRLAHEEGLILERHYGAQQPNPTRPRRGLMQGRQCTSTARPRAGRFSRGGFPCL